MLDQVRILVIGGASLDTLEVADDLIAGGAGMYTAMAANRAGATVTLYSPRPNPIPQPLMSVAQQLTWIGPDIAVDELARFEIVYRSGRTIYANANFGAEHELTDEQLPADLSNFDIVHLVAVRGHRASTILVSCLSFAKRQTRFDRHCCRSDQGQAIRRPIGDERSRHYFHERCGS